MRNLDDAIAATQVGITLASIGLGFVGEPALAHLIEPALTSVGLGSSAVIHTAALVSLLGVDAMGRREMVHSPDELSLLVDEAKNAGQIRPYAGRVRGNVFRLSKTRVRDVMVPREQVFAVHRSAQTEELLGILRDEGYTRIPVYDRGLDDIVGEIEDEHDEPTPAAGE